MKLCPFHEDLLKSGERIWFYLFVSKQNSLDPAGNQILKNWKILKNRKRLVPLRWLLMTHSILLFILVCQNGEQHRSIQFVESHYSGPEGSQKKRGRRPSLTFAEENLIAKLCLEFADNGVPLSRNKIEELIHLHISKLPKKGEKLLPFKNGKPD